MSQENQNQEYSSDFFAMIEVEQYRNLLSRQRKSVQLKLEIYLQTNSFIQTNDLILGQKSNSSSSNFI